MRPRPSRFLALSLATLLAATAGCTRETVPATPVVATEPVPPASATAPDPCARMKTALGQATRGQQAGLSDLQQQMDREIDALVAAKKAAGADVSQAADEKLDRACEDFAEKLRLLSTAGEESWDNAKHNAGQALQNVSDAFAQVMESPPRK